MLQRPKGGQFAALAAKEGSPEDELSDASWWPEVADEEQDAVAGGPGTQVPLTAVHPAHLPMKKSALQAAVMCQGLP